MANTVTDDMLDEILRTFGLFPSNDNREQFRVMVEAMFIYEERENARGGLWKEAGAIDSAHHLQSKARRIVFAVEHGKPEAVNDDGLDAVNYATFAVRNTRAGRIQPT